MELKKGQRGSEVLRLQLELLHRGFKLPKFGADADLGGETLEAARQCAASLDLPAPIDTISEDFLAKLGITGLLAQRECDGVPVIDLRAEQIDKKQRQKELWKLDAKGRPVRRDPATITGIVVHQTAVEFGTPKKTAVDPLLALARRSLDVRCHMMVFRSGFVAWPNQLERYIFHGNAFNATTLGIEIDGNYPGKIGGKTWNDEPATVVTDELVRAARAAITLLVREAKTLGIEIKHIYAHRQSSPTRRADPGEELWKRVVLEHAVPVLGLQPERQRVLKKTGELGRPIPRDWDPEGEGDY